MIDRGLRPAAILFTLAMPLGAAPANATQDPALVTAAIRAAALAQAPPGVSLTLGPVTGAKVMPACTEALAVNLSGMAPYEQAAVLCPAPAWTLYVTVTLTQRMPVLVAARPVAAGQELAPADLMLKSEPVSLYAGRVPFYDLAQLVGAEATMSLPAGAVFTPDNIEEPVLVKAGQTVVVEALSGSVEVSVNAVADETGRLGDTILLTNPSSGQRFSALVTAAGLIVRLQS